MKHLLTIFCLTVLIVVSPLAQSNTEKMDKSNQMLLVRADHKFEDTLDIVKDVLHKNGFEVAHVQRCDGGLKHMGYNTDKYRIVFFGRLEEVREISKTHSELIPFLPFKLLVYAEGNQSIISIMNPENLKGTLKDKAFNRKLEEWKDEFVKILEQTKAS